MSIFSTVRDWFFWLLHFVDEHNGAVTAIATVFLVFITWFLGRITRIIQRAYLDVRPQGIHLWSTGDRLVGHVTFHNAGRLPARKVRWLAGITPSDDDEWKGFDYTSKPFVGKNVIPPGGEMTEGSDSVVLTSVTALKDSDAENCFLYVWGRVHYKDGCRRNRFTDFCHRYNYRTSNRIGPGGYELPPGEARYHRYGNNAD